MAQTITFNGTTYTIPDVGDTGWGQNLTNYFVGIPQGCLQKTGGVFTLTADVDFGASFGLLSQYYKTRTANPATAGLIRLAAADLIEWRNNGNSANLTLGLTSKDFLNFSGQGFISNNNVDAYTTTATAAGTTTLTVSSTKQQYFTGSTTQNIVLPNATTLPQIGFQFRIVNLSSGSITIKDNGGTTLLALPGVSWTLATCTSVASAAGTWDLEYSAVASGTVSSVALSLPNIFTVSGSPVTTSGTLTATLANQNANTILAGPTSGAASTPSFRTLITPDVSQVVQTKTALYSALITDDLILCNTNAFTVTLPAASAMTGKILRISKIGSDANAITISRSGSDTIEGSNSTSLNTQYEIITLQSDGNATWYIIERQYPQSWISYTPTLSAAFGTTSGLSAFYRRIGDSIDISVAFTCGTLTAALGSISIPNSWAIDTTKICVNVTTASNGQKVGDYVQPVGTVNGPVVACTSTSTNLIYIGTNYGTASSLTPSNISTPLSGSNLIEINARVPISGWSG